MVLKYVLAVVSVVLLYLTQVRKIGWRDVRFTLRMLNVKRLERKAAVPSVNLILPRLWARILASIGRSRECIFYVDTLRSYTFGDVEDISNRIAHFCRKQGVRVGDVVAVYMDNCPEYFTTWLGVSKMGGRSALVNYNLKHTQLMHSLEVSKAKILIFNAELQNSIKDPEVLEKLKRDGVKMLSYFGKVDFCPSLDEELESVSKDALPEAETAHALGVKFKDPALYVYTSGTTGLPKAAIITHHRVFLASEAFTLLGGITEADRVYCTLPLYHSAAGIVGLGFLLQCGSTLILRKKFSASNFGPELRKYNITVVQYIGELCRYVCHQPVQPEDNNTHVRVAIGNGLRPDVWKDFQSRFNIERVVEFYAATEGAGALINTENKFGAVGFISPLFSLVSPIKICKYDAQKDELVRDSRGFCIECKYGEEGECLFQIRSQAHGVSNFSGYTNQAATEKKIATNVAKKGDRFFRSGDLLKRDSEGFVYFVDRIGDTFRWKGENCSTSEISEVVSAFSSSLKEVNVYGVRVGDQDGRAGMAAIVCGDADKFDWDGLSKHVNKELASYARPLFVRVMPAMEITGTFKHRKVELRDEGFDPRKIHEPLYFLKGGVYAPLTPELYDDIVSQKVKL